MSGLPGSGKDTWLATNRPGLPVVSLDDLRAFLAVDATENQGEVIQAARESCREHLRAGRDFVFNATNTVRQTRKRWIDLFADYGARVELVYVEPPLPVIFRFSPGIRGEGFAWAGLRPGNEVLKCFVGVQQFTGKRVVSCRLQSLDGNQAVVRQLDNEGLPGVGTFT
jgi:hypothetical protein